MIILERGNREPWWTGIKFRCHVCKANLELEAKDVPVIYFPAHGFFSHCPLCASSNSIGNRPKITEEINGPEAK